MKSTRTMDVRFEGAAAFASKPSVAYRYQILPNETRLKLWLENRGCKFQW